MNEEEIGEKVTIDFKRGYCFNCDRIVEIQYETHYRGWEIKGVMGKCPECSEEVCLIDPVTERVLERLERLEQFLVL